MRLTRRGIGVLIAGVLALVVGEVLGYAVLRVIAGAALAAVAAGVVMGLRRLKISATRDVVPDRVEFGQPSVAHVALTNESGHRTAGFAAQDNPSLDPDIWVPPLAPGATSTHTHGLPTGKRGKFAVGPVTITQHDLLGLLEARKQIGEPSTLRVYPRTHSVQVRPGAHPRHHHEGVVGESPLTGSMELESVREYVVGDEARHIHWRATARTGGTQIMVSAFADPSQPRFVVLLDNRRSTLDADGFEAAVEIAASLVHAATGAGHHTRLLTTTGLDIGGAGTIATRRSMLDALCEVQQVRAPGLDAALLGRRCDAGAAVTVLSGPKASSDTALVGAIRRRASDVVLFDFGAEAGQAPPGVLSIRHRDPAVAARAWNAVVL